MRFRIIAKNLATERHPFIAIGYERAAIKARKGLQEVTRIETDGGDPGETITIEGEWPTPDYPPTKMAWKAPPKHSLVWELQEFTLDGRSMIHKPGMFA